MPQARSKRTTRSETRQVAALPWRLEDGERRILMITSRETRRWVIPKGGRMVGKSDPEAAAELFRRALSIDPSFTKARLALESLEGK